MYLPPTNNCNTSHLPTAIYLPLANNYCILLATYQGTACRQFPGHVCVLESLLHGPVVGLSVLGYCQTVPITLRDGVGASIGS